MGKTKNNVDTVDGRNPANQLRLVVYPIIYKVLYIQTMIVWDFWTINSIFSRFQLVHENWPVFGAAAFCRQVVAIEIGGFSLSTTNQLGATFWMPQSWFSGKLSEKMKGKKRSYWRYTHFFPLNHDYLEDHPN